MSEQNEVPADVRADLDAVVAAYLAGKKPDPELARRVRERAEAATKAIYKRFGELNLAVNLIRQGRDDD